MQKLLNGREFQLIDQLSLVAKRKVTGFAPGEQRSPVQGGGIEFADYREYQPGDDIRRIDWAVFLRLRRLLVKLCAEEKELTLMVLLDTSRSMGFGEPDKLWMAAKISAILTGITLNGGNRAGVAILGSSFKELIAPARSRSSLVNIVTVLERIEPSEAVDLARSIRQFAACYGRKCMAVLISDLLDPEWPQVISGLSTSSCEGFVIQLLAPEELEPPHLGEITLVDLETQCEVPLHLGWEIAQKYRRELAVFLKEVHQSCHRVGLGHTIVSTAQPLVGILQDHLQKEGLLC